MGHRSPNSTLARTLARPLLAAALAVSFAQAAPAQQSAQGVGPKEIVVGTHADLSGPLLAWGAAVRNGLTMAFDEANHAGGVNGRSIRLIVRDDAYDPAKAAEATRRLSAEDRVFAILSPLGTPTAEAAMTQALARGVLYLFPLTASEDAFLPPATLKFALAPTHAMETQEGLRRILNARGPLKVGLLASDDSFGRAVRTGVTNEISRRGRALAAEVTFAPGETGFDAQLAKLKAQGVELVVLGAEAEEALAVARTAQAMRWHPVFLCSSACYAPEFATLGGAEAEGLYAVSQVAIPYPDDAKLGAWARKYEATFSTVASVQALTAYRNARLFLTVLRQAGAAPTQAAFARLLENRGAWTDPNLGGLPIEFTPTDHLGSHTGLLAQIRRGRWTTLTDLPPAARP